MSVWKMVDIVHAELDEVAKEQLVDRAACDELLASSGSSRRHEQSKLRTELRRRLILLQNHR